MAKFMILYSSAKSASEVMASSTPEQMKASMDAWIKWKDQLDPSIKFEFGMPLEAVQQITPMGTSASTSKVSGYSTMEAESKEMVIEALKSHPQLERPDSSIDVLEVKNMPGIETE